MMIFSSAERFRIVLLSFWKR